ncbi:MAG: SBBP repeat-containing protein, partial [Bacteroidia bacterium]
MIKLLKRFMGKSFLNSCNGVAFLLLIIFNFTFDNNQLHAQGFIENQGQYHNQDNLPVPHVKYVGKNNQGLQIQLREKGFSYELLGVKKAEEGEKNSTIDISRVDINFINPNNNFEIITENGLLTQTNYYLTGKRIEGVSTFEKVTYKNVWDNIDIVFYSDKSSRNGFKYEFLLHPDAQLSNIEFNINGSNNWEINEDGDNLTLYTDQGKIEDILPYSYENSNEGIEIPIEIHWKKTGDLLRLEAENGLITTETVIDPDPTLIWGTYYGGSSSQEGTSVSIDSKGNPVFCGWTTSSSLATSGVYKSSYQGNTDAFVFKMKREGGSSGRIWMTYFGGANEDYINGNDHDSSDNVYVVGVTSSDSLGYNSATSYDSSFGYQDAFIARLDTAGKLKWFNYFGDTLNDAGNDIDVCGNLIHAVGYSEDAKRTNGSAPYISVGSSGGNSTYQGQEDAFYVQLDTSGNIKKGFLFGGSSYDAFQSVYASGSGKVAILGATRSTSNISTISGSSKSSNSDADAMVLYMDTSGMFSWSRYFGGSAYENFYIDANGNASAVNGGIVLNSKEEVFITGTTYSQNGISQTSSTGISHKQYLNDGSVTGVSDAYLTKIGTSGSIVWSSYYGGKSSELGRAVTIDTRDFVYIIGQTESENSHRLYGTPQPNVIATDDALQSPSLIYGQEGFVVKFRDSGTRIWGTYIAGNKGEDLFDIAGGLDGDLFIAGRTNSTSASNLPLRNSYQSSLTGSIDGYFLRLNYCKKFLVAKTNIPCVGDSLILNSNIDSSKFDSMPNSYSVNWGFNFPNTYNVNWYQPDGTPFSQNQNTSLTVTSADTGTYTVIVENEFGCLDTAEVTVSKINDLPNVQITTTNYCQWDTINLVGNSTKTINSQYTWRGPGSWTATGKNVSRFPALKGVNDGEYILSTTDTNGCENADTVNLSFGPDVSVSTNSPVCPNSTINLTASGNNISNAYWSGPNSFADTGLVISISNARPANEGVYTAFIEDVNGCKDTINTTVALRSLNQIDLSAPTRICVGQSLKITSNLTGTQGNTNASFLWTLPNTGRTTKRDSNILEFSNSVSADSGRYNLRVTDANGCFIDTYVNVAVEPLPSLDFSISSTPQCLKNNSITITQTISNSPTYYYKINGTTWTSQNPGTISFANAGTYPVKLIGVSQYGCKDSL